MAYSNVTPPTLPAYDSETYGFYLLVFNYELGSEDWYMVHLIYSAWRFHYEEGLGVTNTGNTFIRTYSDGTWTEELQNPETLALNPGISGNVYQRIYTNANIFNGDEIWLAADTVTPVEEEPVPEPEPEEPKKFPFKQWMGMYLLGVCSPRRAFPQREPIGYLYGHIAKDGETPTHTINGVDYVGNVLPKAPEVEGYEYAFYVGYIGGYMGHLYLCKNEITFSDGTFKIGSHISVTCRSSSGWGDIREITGESTAVWQPDKFVCWTNTDIINADDGSVFLHAIDPIPIYE